jgi:hypothetical protein
VARETAVVEAVAVPKIVRRAAERALGASTGVPSVVRITQRGEMWQKRGGRTLRFTATQAYAVDRVAFTWRARFPLVGPVGLTVVDGYDGGTGRLQARLLGIPVQTEDGPDTAVAEAMRYLAELPWVPFALLANAQIEWSEDAAGHVRAATPVGASRAVVELEIDAAGDVVGASAPARPRAVGKGSIPTPWGGEFRKHATVGGIRIPTEAEVHWELDDGPLTYWRGTVTSLDTEGVARGRR